MNCRIKFKAGNVKQVVSHDIAPANFVFEDFSLGQLAALAAIVFIVVVFSVVILAPLREPIHFFWIGENNLKIGLFFYQFKIIIKIMMILVPVSYDLGSGHGERAAISKPLS